MRQSRCFLMVSLALFGMTHSATGQLAPPPAKSPTAGISLLESGLILGGIAALSSAFDETADHWVLTQGSGSQGTARVFKRMGQPEVYATTAVGILASGLIFGDRDLTRAGVHVVGSLALAGTLSTASKFIVGRQRPSIGDDADVFAPLSGNDALPSGHTVMAFALAASLSDEIHRPWASVLLYTAATGTAWSRVHDHRHWLSDVAAGAILGVASAKFVNGKWTVFGVRAPQILPGPAGVTVGWNGTF